LKNKNQNGQSDLQDKQIYFDIHRGDWISQIFHLEELKKISWVDKLYFIIDYLDWEFYARRS
jgi:hypothetical protein